MKRHILDYQPGYHNAFEDSEAIVAGPVSSPDINPATGKAWTFLEKLLGVASQSVDVVNKYKSGTVTTASGPVSSTVGRVDPAQGPTFLGMPRNVGIGVTVAVVGVIGFAIWKLNKK